MFGDVCLCVLANLRASVYLSGRGGGCDASSAVNTVQPLGRTLCYEVASQLCKNFEANIYS